MATQLQFSRRVYEDRRPVEGRESISSSPAWNGSPRHVAFAVQDAVPSPQLYHHQRRYYEREEDRHEYYEAPTPAQGFVHSVRDTQVQYPLETAVRPVKVAQSQPPRRAKASATVRKASAPKKTKTQATRVMPVRKPGWDTDVRAPAAVFDVALKKSVLFQARAGDRLREVHQEEQTLNTKQSTAVKPRVRSSTSAWNARIARSIPTTTTLPRRKPKDFVKMNMEKITGQRYETLVQRGSAPTQLQPRGSVFERLAAPTLHKSVPQFRTPSPTRTPVQPTTVHNHEDTNEFSPAKLTIASPVTAHTREYAAEDPPRRSRSPRAVRTSPNQERGSSPRSASRVSPPGSRISSPGFRSDRGSHEQEQPSMAAQVFEVLDRQRRGRIGVNQILDGLRLLHLPATHNQVSDYVYLIHEGAVSTIDLEEWIILVGTLDAASQPVSGDAMSQPPSTRSRTSPQPTRDISPPRSRSSRRDSPPRSVNQRQSPSRASPKLVLSSPDGQYESHDDHCSGRGAIASNEPREDPEDWYMQAIQRRVDEMYERAEEVVAQRQGSGGSNQMLERAASAVYHLKSSLYPLVEQAEAMLKDAQQHQTTKLSVRVAPQDLSRIASHSEDLANLLFDDILLDTVEELNKEERYLSQQQLQTHHADTLDEILLQIQTLEMAEDELINNPYSMAYVVDGDSLHEKLVSRASTKPIPPSTQHEQNKLTLPLGVVMGVGTDDESFEDFLRVDVQDTTIHKHNTARWDLTGDYKEDDPPHHVSPALKVSMAILGGQLFQRIEKNRVRFSKHRQLVESSLEATGMDQASVIEMLADLLLDDITTECALELESGVETLTDTLAETLV